MGFEVESHDFPSHEKTGDREDRQPKRDGSVLGCRRQEKPSPNALIFDSSHPVVALVRPFRASLTAQRLVGHNLASPHSGRLIPFSEKIGGAESSAGLF
jgi:hypothetical protein